MKRFLLLFFLVFGCGVAGWGQTLRPKALITGTNDNGCVPLTRTFQNQSTFLLIKNNNDSTILAQTEHQDKMNFEIDWGDGTVESLLAPNAFQSVFTHTFTKSTCEGTQHINGDKGLYVSLTMWETGKNQHATKSTIGPIKIFGETKAVLITDKTEYCLNEQPVTFVDSSLVYRCSEANDFTMFNLDFGDGSPEVTMYVEDSNEVSGFTKTHTYGSPGKYKAILTVNTVEKCTDGSDTVEVNILSEAQAVASLSGATNFCLINNGKVKVVPTNQSTGGNLTYTWSVTPASGWVFANGTNKNDSIPEFEFSQPGSYAIKLIAANKCLADTTIMSIDISDVPAVSITANPMDICAGESVLPTAVVNNNNSAITAYNWTFENGNPSVSSDLNPDSITFSSAGDHDITFYATNVCGQSESQTLEISVRELPNANITVSGATTICAGNQVELTATSCATCTYVWHKNNTTITPTTDVIKVAETGNYTVEVSKKYNDTITCKATSSTPTAVTINPNPVNPQANNQNRCGPGDLTLTATGSGSNVTYNWYSGLSGGSALHTGSSYTPNLSQTTTYYVEAEENTTGCKSGRVAVTATVFEVPDAPTAVSHSVCGPQNVTLQANGTGSVFNWYDTPSSTTVLFTGKNHTEYLSQSADYYVSTVSADGCESARTKVNVNVNPIPDAPASTKQEKCGPGDLTLTATGAGNGTYQWFEHNQSTVLQEGASNTFVTPVLQSTKSYEVLIKSDSGCKSPKATVDAVILPVPQTPQATNDSVCGSGSIALVATSGQGNPTYVWYADTTQAALQTGSQTYNTPVLSQTTYYFVSLKSNNNCESGKVKVAAIVNPNPTVSLSNNGKSQFCKGNQTTLKATTTPTANIGLQWYNQGSLISGQTQNELTVATSGSYTVKATVNTSGCVATSGAVAITVYDLPAVSAGNNLELCDNDAPMQLTGFTPSGGTWTGTGIDASGVITPQNASIGENIFYYSVTDGNSCVNQDSLVVTVKAKPSVDAGSDLNYCPYDTVIILGGQPAGGQWSGPGISGGNNFSLSGAGSSTGQGHKLYYQVAQNGCTNRDSIRAIIDVPSKPNAGNDTAVCISTSSIALAGSPTGGHWTGTGVANNQFNVSSAGVGTHFLVYTIGQSTCARKDTIAVTVNPLPKITDFVDFSVCHNAPPHQLNAKPLGGTWLGTGVTGTNQFDPKLAGAGTHNVSYKVTDANNCTSEVTKTITVNHNPVLGVTITDTCFKQKTTFKANATTNGAATNVQNNGWLWNIHGSPTASNANTVQHTFNSPGTKNVSVVVTDQNNCKDTAAFSVTVLTLPRISVVTQPVCFGDTTTINSLSTSNNGTVEHNWSFKPSGSLVSQNQATAKVIFDNHGLHNVSLQVQDGLQCKSDTSFSVTVNKLPQVDAGPAVSLCANGLPEALTGASPASGLWHGNGITDATNGILDPSIITPGNYFVKYVYTDANTCSNTDSVEVTINKIPNVVVAPNTQAFCYGNLPDTILGFSPQGGKWSGTGIVNDHVGVINTSLFGDTGTFMLYYTYTDPSTQCTNTDTLYAKLTNAVAVDAGNNSTVCVNQPTFNFTGYAPTGGIWSGPGVDNAASGFKPASAGLGNKAFYYTYGSKSCRRVDTVSVKVLALPTPNVVLNDVCLGNQIIATNNTSSLTPISKNVWRFGNSPAFEATNTASFLFDSAGIYTVSLVQTSDSGCVDSAKTNAQVFKNPKALFSIADTCIYDNVAFTNESVDGASQITNAVWHFGDGATQNKNSNVSHKYDTAKTYSATLLVTDANACADTFERAITITQPPKAHFIADEVCFGQSTFFVDSSHTTNTITQWHWNFDNAATSNVPNPTFKFVSSGTYSVGLEVTDTNGCTHAITKTIKVNNAPNANFIPNHTCFQDSTLLTDNSTSVDGSLNNWKWIVEGHADTLIGETQKIKFDSPGKFATKLVVKDNNACAGTYTDTILVYQLPTAHISQAQQTVCLGAQSVFADTSVSVDGAINTWNWDFGDGAAATTQQQPTHTYATADTFVVRLRVETEYGCTDTTTAQHHIAPLPVANFSADTVCQSFASTLTDISTPGGGQINTWQWHLNTPNLLLTDSLVTHTFGDAGSFATKLVVTDTYGCTDSITKNVEVNAAPQAKFTGSNVCLGDSLKLFDASAGVAGNVNKWSWAIGFYADTLTTKNVVLHADTVGAFAVSLWVGDNNACAGTYTDTVLVYQLPTAHISQAQQTVCLGAQSVFADTSVSVDGAINTLNWDFGDGAAATTPQHPTHTYATADTFVVRLRVETEYGCTDSTMANHYIAPLPVANFSADTVCQSFATTLTDISTPGGGQINTWQWHLNTPNLLLTDSLVTHTFGDAGSFATKLVVTDTHGCTDSITKNVEVNAAPQAKFTGSNVCSGDSLKLFDASAGVAGNVNKWSWAIGFYADTLTTKNVVLHADTVGAFAVSLWVGDNNACAGTYTDTILVYQLPTARISQAQQTVCLGAQSVFADTSVSVDGAINTLNWDFGDGAAATTPQHPTHTYATADTFVVRLRVETEYGCTDSTMANHYIAPLPVANFSADTACFGSPTLLSDSSAMGHYSINSWNWQLENTDTVGATLNYIFAAPGQYSVRLKIIDSLGCADSTTKTVKVNKAPNASFVADSVCRGSATMFTNLSASDDGVVQQHLWNFDNLGNAVAADTVFTFPDSGRYNVTLKVWDNNSCFGTTQKTVVVYKEPIPNITTNYSCHKSAHQFKNSTTSFHGSTSYLWYFGDSTQQAAPDTQTVLHTYDLVGTYKIFLKAISQFGCVGQDSTDAEVKPLPISAFTVDSVCATDTVTLINNSLGTDTVLSAFLWQLGNGDTLASSLPVYAYAIAGFYTISLEVTDANGCKDTSKAITEIFPAPRAAFGVADTCLGDSVKFTDLSVPLSGNLSLWLWVLGDGTQVTNKTAFKHKYNAAQKFEVTVRVQDNNGCAGAKTDSITILNPPQAGFFANNACQDYPVQFNDTSLIIDRPLAQWQWQFGQGNATDHLQNPVFTYQGTGVFSVSLIATDLGGCKDTIQQNVRIYQPPMAQFAADTVCLGDSTTFTNLSTPTDTLITNWYWYFNNAMPATDTLINTKAVYAQPGSHQAVLEVVDANGCKDTLTKTNILVNPGPVANFTATRVCLNQTTSFTDASVPSASPYLAPIANWFWDFGDGATATQQHPTHTYLKPDTFNVLLTITDIGGCRTTVSKQVIVDGLPVANFTTNNVCLNTLASFTNTSDSSFGGLINWQWSMGHTGQTLYAQNINFMFPDSGVYEVGLLVTNQHGCQHDTTKQLYVYPLPVANYLFDTVCAGSATTFNDLSYGVAPNTNGQVVHWHWDFDDGSNALLQNPTHVFPSASVYQVKLRVADTNACADSITQAVLVNPAPVALFTADSVCLTHPTTFADHSYGNTVTNSLPADIVKWLWDFGDSTITQFYSTFGTVSHTYLQPGNYWVTLTVFDQNGCSHTYGDTIVVYPLPNVSYQHDSIACLNTNEPFYNLTSGADSYTWYFGDNNSSTLTNPLHAYADTGFFTVSLLALSQIGCLDSSQSVIEVILPPVAGFAMDKDTGCGPLTVNFTDSSTGKYTTYFWDFGNGQTFAGANPDSITFKASLYQDTTYFIKLTLSNKCDTSIFIDSVTVFPSPWSRFAISTYSGCAPLLVNFMNYTTGLPEKFMWWFSDTDSSNVAYPTHRTFGANGQDTNYVIKLMAYNKCGADTLQRNLFVKPNTITAGFAVSDTAGCQPFTLNAYAGYNGVAVNSVFSFGDGNMQAADSVTHTYNQAGNFTLTQVVTNNCGLDTATANIKVWAKPSAIINLTDSTPCLNDTVIVKDLSTGHNKLVLAINDLPVGGFAHSLPLHRNTADTVLLYLTATDTLSGCADTTQATVYYHPAPIPIIGTSADSVCGPDSIRFYNQSPNHFSSFWHFNHGVQTIEENPVLFFDSIGKYQATLTVINANGCVGTSQKTVMVNPLPKVSFNYSTDYSCTQPFELTLKNTADTLDYQIWHIGAVSQKASYIDTVITINRMGEVAVRLSAHNKHHCHDTLTKIINSIPAPGSGFSVNTYQGCPPLVIEPTPHDTLANSYLWQINAADSVTTQYPTMVIDTPGVYVLALQTRNQGLCTSATQLRDSIVVFAKPKANYSIETSYLGRSNMVNFVNLSTGAETFYWYLGNGFSDFYPQPAPKQYPIGTTYQTYLIAENKFGCTDSVAKSFSLQKSNSLYIPNAFMPHSNSADINVFKPVGAGLVAFKIEVYDLWGKKIWESSLLDQADGSPTGYWDGTVDGQMAPVGSYTWKIIKAIFENGKEYKGRYTGDVTLIK